jgi:hypothetical protein
MWLERRSLSRANEAASTKPPAMIMMVADRMMPKTLLIIGCDATSTYLGRCL